MAFLSVFFNLQTWCEPITYSFVHLNIRLYIILAFFGRVVHLQTCVPICGSKYTTLHHFWIFECLFLIFMHGVNLLLFIVDLNTRLCIILGLFECLFNKFFYPCKTLVTKGTFLLFYVPWIFTKMPRNVK